MKCPRCGSDMVIRRTISLDGHKWIDWCRACYLKSLIKEEENVTNNEGNIGDARQIQQKNEE